MDEVFAVTSSWPSEKNAVLQTALKMADLGLTTALSGNVSTRLPSEDGRDLLAITPLGVRYSQLTVQDIPVVDFNIEPVEGDLAPSSESLLHAAIYRARPDVGAVIHTHSLFCSVAAVSGREIPPIIDEMVIAIGGPPRLSCYAAPGSQDMADNVCAALGDRGAALIRNHGAVGVGGDLEEALDVCALLERVAQVFYYVSLLGTVHSLPDDVVESEKAIYRMRLEGRSSD